MDGVQDTAARKAATGRAGAAHPSLEAAARSTRTLLACGIVAVFGFVAALAAGLMQDLPPTTGSVTVGPTSRRRRPELAGDIPPKPSPHPPPSPSE